MPKKAINTILTFTEDFRHTLTEPLKQETEATIVYDAKRLPFERSTDAKGKAQWNISAFFQFAAGSEVTEVKLTPAAKGKKAAGETNLQGKFIVPQNATQLKFWFVNTGSSEKVYFDSAFGHNYLFPVIAVEEVEKVTAPAKKSRAKTA